MTLTVNAATLVSIAVSPATYSIAAGTTHHFTATGHYSDGTTQNLTTSVAWTATGAASISNTSPSQGLATAGSTAGAALIRFGVGAGELNALVEQEYVKSAVRQLAQSGATSSTLVSIAVSPTASSIVLGTSQPFTASGTYSDNTTQDLTATVTWNSDATSVATISNSGSNGLATSVATGTAHISAMLGSVTSTTSATLTVTPATLVSIAVTPAPASVVLGLDEQFTATGTYTDNTNQNLTSSVVWSSDTTSVATISNASNSWGLATGLALGSANITAAINTPSGTVTSPPVALTVGAGTETPLYSFSNGADGGNPSAGLVEYSPGVFYGTTSGDGSTGYGTVYKITVPSNGPAVEQVLHTFSNANGDGGSPVGGLLLASDGNFYGTTLTGGAGGIGCVYQIDPAGNLTVIYSFGFNGDGRNPKGTLIQDGQGNLYGTTSEGGGPGNFGTVFELTLTPNGPQPAVETVLYAFQGGADGAYPTAGLVRDSSNNLYGTTFGGTLNHVNYYGTVFKIVPNGTASVETVLHAFTGSTVAPIDGSGPIAGLILGSDGNLYGVTSQGGSSNNGTLFEVTVPANGPAVESVLYSFAGGNDGFSPAGNLIQGSDGTFYGTTQYGGASNGGTLFEFTATGVETVLYSFTGQAGGLAYSDGAGPVGGLTLGSDGSFYGTTIDGGTGTNFGPGPAQGGYGTVFKY